MGERRSNEMGKLTLETKNTISRDLLQRFMANTTAGGDPGGSDPREEVELNLGLSLGGRFGVDKNSSKLVRSSSIAAILPVVKDDDNDDVLGGKTGTGGSYSGLIRTSSLPVETEEEWRKRKELQSLRRLAAKRRRSEKQKSLTKVEREEYVAAMGRVGSSLGPSLGSGNWDFGGAGKGTMNSGCGGGVAPATVVTSDGLTQSSVPGSVESQASSMSEFDRRHLQGEASLVSVNVSVQSSQERSNQDGSRLIQNPSNKVKKDKGKEIRWNTVDMPCVFTQGDRRIEGILYKYGKGEEVKIMCVCHGTFLSPADFVKHAGGTDVLHPMKHILVNPNSSY